MFNPETGQWMGMSMGMYPYPPFFAPLSAPMVRPEYFQNPMSYRGYRGGPRGRYPRSRGRGSYRGRGGYHDGEYKYENDGYDDGHDHRRKYSRSRSRLVFQNVKAERFESNSKFSLDLIHAAVVHAAEVVRVAADLGRAPATVIHAQIRDRSLNLDRDRSPRNLYPR